MHAVTIVDGHLEWREHPDPEPGAGEVLVRVRAAGLNGADRLQVAGHYPPPPGVVADIPGMELAGEVEIVGHGVRNWQVGDRVMAIVAGGAQAELAVVHERHLLEVPDGLDWAPPATIAMTRSPTCQRRTRSPTTSTSPASSIPGMSATTPAGAG